MDFAEPADGELGAELDAPAAAWMAPGGGFSHQLQLVDVMAQGVEQSGDVGLGVEHRDLAGARLPVPRTTETDGRGIGALALGLHRMEHLADLKQLQIVEAAISVALRRA